jgi:hypothetical protein
VLVWDLATARTAIDELFADLRSAGGDGLEIVGASARLSLHEDAGDCTWPGAIRLRRRLHPVPVVLVVGAWSALRTELRLERACPPPHPGRRLDRWYAGAHAVLDVLRAEIELRARPT